MSKPLSDTEYTRVGTLAVIMFATTSSCWASGDADVGGAFCRTGVRVAESEKRSPMDPAASATSAVSCRDVAREQFQLGRERTVGHLQSADGHHRADAVVSGQQRRERGIDADGAEGVARQRVEVATDPAARDLLDGEPVCQMAIDEKCDRLGSG